MATFLISKISNLVLLLPSDLLVNALWKETKTPISGFVDLYAHSQYGQFQVTSDSAPHSFCLNLLHFLLFLLECILFSENN